MHYVKAGFNYFQGCRAKEKIWDFLSLMIGFQSFERLAECFDTQIKNISKMRNFVSYFAIKIRNALSPMMKYSPIILS